jgi:N-carbamoyl-D-amino-acid hydrolase
MEDREEINSFFEHEMPGPDTRALFNEAKRLKMGFYLRGTGGRESAAAPL